MIRVLLTLGLCLVTLTSATQEPSTSTARSPLVILYDSMPDPEALDGLRGMDAGVWLQINQDRASYKTGIVDTDSIVKQIESLTQGRSVDWVMLDFEEPFFKDLEGPDDSVERMRALASMLSTLREVKRRWPERKWGFYGLPNLPFWVDGLGWSELGAERKRAVLQKAARDATPLLAEADWIGPSVYAYYDPAMVTPGRAERIRGTPELARTNDRAWRQAQVGLAALLARGKPVVPTVCPFWAPGGIAPWCTWIDRKTFISDYVEPVVKMGATGLMLWTGLAYRIQTVTEVNPAEGTTERNFGRDEWRVAMVKDYLGGRQPADWASPEVRARLSRAMSRALVQTIRDLRLWERQRQLPAEQAPVVPAGG